MEDLDVESRTMRRLEIINLHSDLKIDSARRDLFWLMGEG